MAFALTTAHLKEMLALPGCPICRRSRRAARRAVDSFLWESVNDPAARQPFLAGYGLCPDHTRLLAAADIASTGRPLAVNLLYEHLGRVAARDLKRWKQGAVLSGLWQRVRARLGGQPTPAADGPLAPRAACHICATAADAELNMLVSLFDALERGTEDIRDAYLSSDGLCLGHLRMGLAHLSAEHPQAASALIADTTARLERQSAQMKELIRKDHWENREEKLTADEAVAWRRTLTFFTGLPGEDFTHHLEEFE